MKLVDQWRTIEAGLPAGWEDVRLSLTTEQPGDLSRATQVLGSINAGKVGSTVVFHVSSAAGPHGVQRALRALRAPRPGPHLVPPRRSPPSRSPRSPQRTAGAVRRLRACARRRRRELGRSARPPALRLDRSPLRARDRLERAARPNGAPVRADEPGPLRLARRLHVPLLRPVRLRRLTVDGPPLLRAPRRTRGSRARPASSASSPTRTTSTPRGPSGSWAARRCRPDLDALQETGTRPPLSTGLRASLP